MAIKYNRNPGFDVLNCIACLSVIFLHHSGVVHHYNGSTVWLVALAVECLFYFAVPCFFMLTGATLMRYDERYDTKTFFKRRFNRTMIPFLIWSIIWLVIRLLSGTENISQLTIPYIIGGIFNTRFQGVYWFFLPLFMTYLFMPLLNKAKDDMALIKYLIIVLFIIKSCFPLLEKVSGIEINNIFTCSIFGPLFYVLCGYYFSCNKISNKYMGGVLILAVVSLVVRYYVTMQQTLSLGETSKVLFDYYLPTAVFPSIFMFVLVNRHDYAISQKNANLLSKLSSLSLGIYLVHILVMSIELRAMSFIGVDNSSFVWIVFMPVITYILCALIVLIVKRVKVLKFIFP